MLPVLRLAGDGQEHSLEEARESLAQTFGLTPAERAEVLPSGRQRRFDNRVAWAKSFLQQARLITSPRRAHFLITDRGRALLAENLKRVDIPVLSRFEEFREFRTAGVKSSDVGGEGQIHADTQVATPEEILEQAYLGIRSDVASELLAKVKAAPPEFFEKLVVELLVRMGYGGDRSEAGKAIGGSGDEGIDGIISEDRLGLDMIYLQAKRWDGTVGRPEIQKFVGALHGKRAKKGVFITTGTFSADARSYVSHIDPRVVLIDGKELASYMWDLDLGVSPKAMYHVKRIDSDFFSEE